MLQTDLITTRAALAALKSEWDAMADPQGDPLLRHDWFMTSAEAFAAEGDLRVTVARDASGLRAALPLVRDRSGPTPRLRLLGFQLMEPQALPYRDAEALAAVVKAGLKTSWPVSLPRVAADSEELGVLAGVAKARGVCVLRPDTTCTHANPLQADWPAFEKAMPSRKASEIRRRRKRLAEDHGEVDFESVSPSEAEAEAALAGLLRVEAAGWKGQAGTALTKDPALARFVLDYARAAARSGTLRVFNLRVGGEVAAAHLMVEHGGRLWGIKLGADERFHKYGVGVMINHDILRWACQQGLDSLEHLGVAEEWQTRWPLLTHRQSTFHFYPRSPAGAAALTLDVLDFAQRRVRSRLQARASARQAKAPEPAA